MNLLLVGNKAVFEPYLVATYYLEQAIDHSIFGNTAIEQTKQAILVGCDSLGNQVYTLGNANPELVVLVHEELQRVDRQEVGLLWVAPITATRVWVTVVLAKLAGLPLIGGLFRSLACSWVYSRRQDLMSQAKSLSPPQNLTKYSAAAKPMR